jgi:hypothetical protein
MVEAAKDQRRAFMFVLLLCLFVLAGSALGQQQITIRFVDYRSGAPIKNFYLSFWSGKWSGAIIPKDTSIREKYCKEHDGKVSVRLPQRVSEDKTVVFEASARVDRYGRLTIYFPETLPEHIRVSTVFDVLSSPPDFDPSEVIKTGEGVPFQHGHIEARPQFSRTPGEIVIAGKKRTAWDRMRQEIP